MLSVALECPDATASFFGYMGVSAAVVFSNLGAGIGTVKSGVGIASLGVLKPDLVMKNIIPVVMAGIIGIYGLIVGIIINQNIGNSLYSLFDGFAHLASGLCCGLSGLAAGLAIGVIGDAGVRANGKQPSLYISMILILIFAEALALYGLIVAIVLSQLHKDCVI